MLQEDHLKLENLSLKAQNRQLMSRALKSTPSPAPAPSSPPAAAQEAAPEADAPPALNSVRHLCETL